MSIHRTGLLDSPLSTKLACIRLNLASRVCQFKCVLCPAGKDLQSLEPFRGSGPVAISCNGQTTNELQLHNDSATHVAGMIKLASQWNIT